MSYTLFEVVDSPYNGDLFSRLFFDTFFLVFMLKITDVFRAYHGFLQIRFGF
jgi:hypothetical protein